MINNIDFSNTVITGGFWKQKQDMVRKTTVNEVYKRFDETGRFNAFNFDWKPGDPNEPHFFWDSDVAKWMEGAAYLIKLKKDKRLEKIIDKIVDKIVKNQADDGYFNIYHTVVLPDRFADRNRHELYCAGHLFEASVAYYEATGKRKFLDAMCKYADYIEKRFVTDKDTGFTTPGHEEIELALVRLYHTTGNERYLKLSKFFVDERGQKEEFLVDWSKPAYDQAHLPVREQNTAEGHAVRAVYLYCGMADIAYETGDTELKSACMELFDNIINKRMYITGGIGSSSCGEAFTVDYDLMNIVAYTETCAALGLALFAQRMLKLDINSKYADIAEKAIYNGFMSSTSLDGTAFFYENPLEIIPYLHTRNVSATYGNEHFPMMQRQRVFDCSCCPPNIVRFIPSIANFLYSDDGETLYIHHFIQSKTEYKRGNVTINVSQRTQYPENGRVKITVSGADTKVAVRIPGWCDSYKGQTVNGYAYFDVKEGDTLSFNFIMKPKFIEARPEVIFNCNRYAVTRGPIVYCMEEADNGKNLRDIRIDSRARFTYGKHTELGVPTLTVKAYRRSTDKDTPLYKERDNALIKTTATLIPYYAFANRGVSEMQVWHFIK